MTGFVAVLAIILAAWNPALFAERSPGAERRRRFGWAVAGVAVVGIAAATGPILDFLAVSVPTFRTAVGAVIALVGGRWLVGPAPRASEGDQLAHGAMDVATPEIVAAAMVTTASDGWTLSVVGIAAAATLSLVLVSSSATGRGMPWLRRLIAGGAVAVGVALIYAGIRAV